MGTAPFRSRLVGSRDSKVVGIIGLMFDGDRERFVWLVLLLVGDDLHVGADLFQEPVDVLLVLQLLLYGFESERGDMRGIVTQAEAFGPSAREQIGDELFGADPLIAFNVGPSIFADAFKGKDSPVVLPSSTTSLLPGSGYSSVFPSTITSLPPRCNREPEMAVVVFRYQGKNCFSNNWVVEMI